MQTVKITSDGNPYGSAVTDAETGKPIHGVGAATVRISAGDLVRADLELNMLSVDVEAKATYVIAHPVTGEMKNVQKIVFADGTEFVAAEPDHVAVKTVDGKVHYLPR